jgi:glycosyltransferase involved in cell wall biosynthesis
MRAILNVVYDERIGGPQLRVLQVAQRLKNAGFGTVVAMPRGDPEFAALLDQVRIPFHEMDLVRLRRSFNPIEHLRYVAKFWRNVRELRQLIRERHIDIVHTNGLMNLQAAVAAHLESVGLVWHLNDLRTPKLLRLLFLPLARVWSHGIALASRAVGHHCFRDVPVGDERIQLLYAPVDTRKFSPQVDGTRVREELSIAPECPVIGIIANICPGKGQEHFLEAAALIKRRYPDAKFLIVGGKLDNRRAFWSTLTQQIAKLGLERYVFFLGRRRDVPQVLRAMTVYVQASESEACPMAVLEASASALPVVATNVGGTPELVADDVTGILVEPRNPRQIAGAVVRLLDSPQMAVKMGLAGAERMRKNFSLEACVDAHVQLYKAVLSRRVTSPHEAKTRNADVERFRDVYSRR